MQYITLRALISLVCLSLIAVHHWMPMIELDAITLGLLGAGVLPWLQPIFKTIKFPGGFEITLQELKQEVKAAAGAAKSAERQAELAISGIAPPIELPGRRLDEIDSSQAESLARQYERIRAEQERGPTRSRAMTAVVRQMIELAPQVTDSDLVSLLRSKKSGDRLSAYANLYARPRPVLLDELVTSVTAREDRPFSQYWGLQSIARNLPSGPLSTPSPSTLQTLVAYSKNAPPGSDRSYEIGRILDQLGVHGSA